MNIAIIIPTYNEKDNIKKVVAEIFSVLPKSEIVIVDDNSPDGTARAVRNLLLNNGHLHLIVRKRKGGRGSAVIDGFRYAHQKFKPDIFVEMDGDLSHDPSELPKLLHMSKPGTVVLASRYVKGGRFVDVSLYRRIMSRLSNALIRLVFGFPISDNTNGYRCYRKDAIELLMKHRFISHGYILLSESAFLLYTRGFSFVETPSIFRNRRFGSSNTSLREFMHALTSILRIRAYVLGL